MKIFDFLNRDVTGSSAGTYTTTESIEPAVVSFATGDDEIEMDVAYPGKFRAMGNKVVEVTADLLRKIASTFDPAKYRPKVQLGHETPASHAPSLGDVTGMRYDEDGGKLYARVKLTRAAKEKIQSGEYRERSISYDEKEGRLLHLGLLGARQPAVSGLAPIPLAAATPTPGIVVVLASAENEVREPPQPEPDPQPSPEPAPEPVDNRGTLKSVNDKENLMPDETAAALAQAEADKKTLQAQVARLQKYADEDVKRFLGSEAIVKRVGLTARGPVETLLTELARMEADGAGVISLAGADGKPAESTLYALAKAVIANLPSQVSETAATEIALAGGDDPIIASFQEVNSEGSELDRLVRREQQKSLAEGKPLKYQEAFRRVTNRHNARA